jgi:predicted Zn-dependent protease
MSNFSPGEIPPPQRPKTNYLLIVVPLAVLGVLMLLGLFGVGLFVVLERQGAFAPPPPRRPSESVAEKCQANAEAFGQGAAENDAEFDETGVLSALLHRTIQIATPEQADACFDFDRMYDEVCAQASLVPSALGRRKFKSDLQQTMARDRLFAKFQTTEIKRVKRLAGPDNLLVFSKHRKADGNDTKMRWWACRARGKWRWYDYEYLQISFRLTSVQAGMANSSPQQEAALDRLNKASDLIVESKFEEAGSELRATLGVRLPKAFDAQRHWELAIVHINSGNPEEALGEIDQAYAIESDLPILPMLRARAFNALGQFEEAEAQARSYIGELGSDDFGSYLLGTALAGMGKKDEAAEAFRSGFADNSSSSNNLVGLASVVGADGVQEIADRFARFERPKAHFSEIAAALVEQENAPALAAVIDRHRAIAPRDPHNDYYQGELHWMQQEYEQAAEAFRLALANSSETERVGCQKALRNSLLYAGKPAEAYRAMPDADDTFFTICNHLVTERDADGLDEVTSLHAERQPDDSWLPYFRGEAHLIRGQYEQAAAAFKPMLNAQLSDGARSSYHDEYLVAEINAGHPLEAYQAVPDAEEAFLKAANRLLSDRNPDDLEKLVSLHAERQPDDPYLAYFRGEVPYLRGQAAEAAAVFEPLLKKELPEGLREPCYREYLRCMFDLGEPIEAYRAVPDAAFAFEFVADILLDRWNGADQLEQLISAHSERLPDDPWLPYYRGRLLMARSQYDDAAELFAPLIGTAQDERLKAELAEACRAALTYGGKPQEAYAISLDHQTGFERTAAYLANQLDADNLAALIATREAEQADDPSLPYFKARLAAIGGDYRAAGILLTPAVAAAGDGENRTRMVDLLLDSLYQIHEAKTACNAVRPVEAFDFLASRLADDGDADLLDEVLMAYASEVANDPQLLYFRGRLAHLRGHDDEAAANLSAWIKNVAATDDGESLDTYLEAMADARRHVEAYQSAPDKSAALNVLADGLARDGQLDSLDALIDLHATDHADDPWLSYWRGRALLLRGKEDGALAAFQSVLKTASSGESPGLVPSTWREFLVIGKPLQAYAMSADPVAAFEYLGDVLLENRDLPRLQQLVAAHQADHADDPALAWLRGELLLADGKNAEAIDLLKPLLSDNETPDADRNEVVYRRAMVKAGRAQELYEAAQDKRSSFRELASELYEAGDTAGLASLLGAHRALEPHDPWLQFFAAQQLRLVHQFDDADRAFAAALADRETASLRWNLKTARIETRYEAGKAISAYEEIGPRLATLNELIDSCRNKRDAPQLEQLLTAHRERFPNDARLPGWGLELAGM